MRRLFLSFAVLALSLISVGVVPQHSVAAPLPAAYSGAAGGDLAAFVLNDTNGPDLAGARLAVSQSTATGGTTPTAKAETSNVVAGATGLGIVAQSNTQTAPPDNPTADTGTLGGGSAPGLFSLGPLNTSVQARTQAVIACRPGGGEIANSKVESNGAILNPTDDGIVFDTGDSSTSGVVAIFPEPASDSLNRAIFSTATGTITSNSFLNGSVDVAIAGNPTLQAIAKGVPGGASVSYTPGTVTVNTTTGGSATVDLGDSQTFDVPGGRVVITVNEPTVTESPNGQTATGTVAVVTAQVIVGSLTAPSATAKIELLPLRASAVAPPGGIDCLPPAPVLNTPADGSTTTDVTPTFTGTAVPGAEVEIFVDGTSIGTTTANNAGNFSFTPTTPLAAGGHTATARQITDGGTSQNSNANDFTVVGPPVLDDPADGTVTNDTTPTFTGTAAPGAQVDILVDGNPIGTATANGAGEFSFTPVTPLSPGDHETSATARLNGVTSGPSNVNGFAIDADAPAAPTLNRPADGEVTRDTTPTFTGSAEPGAEVEIFVDGTSIGTTTANGAGKFSFTPSTPLAAGPHEAFVRATDAAGNDSPPSNTNGFVIDTEDPDAPVITSPADGGTTTDRTPSITGTAEPGSQVIILIDGKQVGSTVADENGEFTFNLPDGLTPGEHEVAAVAVDEAGNRSTRSTAVDFAVLAARADAGPSDQLADTGGPSGWLPVAAAVSLLAGAGILAIARWRRRSSQAVS